MSERTEAARVEEESARATGKGERGATPREGRAPARAAAGEDMRDLLALSGAGLEALASASEAVIRGSHALTGELTSFATRRLRADAEAGRAVLDNAQDWVALTRLQQDYVLRLTQDYLEEAARLGDLAAETTRNAWEPLEGYARRVAAPGGAQARAA